MARQFQACRSGNASVTLGVELTTNTVDEMTIVSTRRPITVWFYNESGGTRRSFTQSPNQTQVYDLAAFAMPVLSRVDGSKTSLRTRFTVHF